MRAGGPPSLPVPDHGSEEAAAALAYGSVRRGAPMRWLRDHARARWWVILVTVLRTILGMAYVLWWPIVVWHKDTWVTPGDIWGTYRSAQIIGFGNLGGIYASGNFLVTFPGVPVLLAPISLLTDALGMSRAYPLPLAHPTAWYLLGPYEMLLSSVPLFALDAIAERLGISRMRRAVLCVFGAAALWNVDVFWGHPEDALSVGLAAYGLLMVAEGRWSAGGWLIGAGLAVQPLVVLVLPAMVVCLGWKHIAGFAVRALAPSVALLATPFIANFRATWGAIWHQPNFPQIDHRTPWTPLAPKLKVQGVAAVAAGPGRLVAVAVAIVLAWCLRRWIRNLAPLIWVAAVMLVLRCLTESVMVAFYIWPTSALALVACALRGRLALSVGGALAVGALCLSNTHLGEWPWWLGVNACLLALLVVGRPRAWRPAGAGDRNLRSDCSNTVLAAPMVSG